MALWSTYIRIRRVHIWIIVSNIFANLIHYRTNYEHAKRRAENYEQGYRGSASIVRITGSSSQYVRPSFVVKRSILITVP